MNTIIIIVIVLLIASMILILSGKGDMLIAGYNTATAERKKKVDLPRLRIVTASLLGLVVALLVSLSVITDSTVRTVVHIAFWVLLVAGIVAANTWAKKK